MRLIFAAALALLIGCFVASARAGMAGKDRHDHRSVHRRRHRRPVRAASCHATCSRSSAASFIVENRAGAGGNIGAAAVAKAPNDGYTLLLGTVSTHAINQFMYSNMQFDPAKDFQPISLIARLPNMLVVNPKIPAKTPAELVTYLKANPDKVTYASSGVGTSIHLAAELFKIKTGTTMTHVPYRSSGEVMQNVTAGHVDLAFDNMTLAWPQAQGRQCARARGDVARTQPDRAERSDHGRNLQGIRGDVLARPVRAGRDAEADRGQIVGRGETHPRYSREQAETHGDRRGGLADDTGSSSPPSS